MTPNNRPKPDRHAGKPRHDPFDGILLVDKPSGMTSHDVVARIRRHFKFRKVGHGGTLDPMATGLLIILIGRGTKLSASIMGSDKTYEGTMHLGISTDTHDVDGNVLEEKPIDGVSAERLEEEMKKWEGDIMQTPPMVSAIKKNGVPLYKLARKGKEVEREKRFLHVYRFQLLSVNLPQATFRLHCTKGTYVRTLCADVGDGLGCGAHLASLRRIASGDLDIKDARTLDDILKMDLAELEKQVITVNQYGSRK